MCACWQDFCNSSSATSTAPPIVPELLVQLVLLPQGQSLGMWVNHSRGSWRSLLGSYRPLYLGSQLMATEKRDSTSISFPTHTILQRTSVFPTSIVGGHCGMYQSRIEFGILIEPVQYSLQSKRTDSKTAHCKQHEHAKIH